MKSNSILESKSDLLFDIFNYTVLSIILIIVAYPLYFIVIASISDPDIVYAGKVLFTPVDLTFQGYTRIFKDQSIMTGYANTTFYTLLGTTINVILTMMISYPLSKKSFSGKKLITVFLLITMYFNGGLIPTYLTIKKLGLYNTRAVMVLIGAVGVFNVIIARTFIQSTIPDDLYEAAAIDGCNHTKFFLQFVMPLSKPVLVVLALYYGVGHWNEFMRGLIYLRDSNKYPLQLVLRSILIQSQAEADMISDVSTDTLKAQKLSELIKFGVIIVSSLPIMLVYPFLQKYFMKGVMIGSLKG